MSGFSRSPRLLKGALIVLEDEQRVKQAILFQYNPDTLTRSLRASYQPSEVRTAGEPRGLRGPPAETISATIEIDAADQLELGLPGIGAAGIYPALAALEALLYPDSETVLADEALRLGGSVSIVPPPRPLVLFAWGAKRVLPVRISQLSITEQAFDPDLNPLLAQVSLSMDVLTYQDLGGVDNVGGALHFAHHVALEALSQSYVAQDRATAIVQQIIATTRG